MDLDDATAATHLLALASTTPDALLIIDEESRIHYVNDAIEDLLGYRPEDLIGQSLTEIMPSGDGDRHLNAVNQYTETGERRIDWEYLEMSGRHSDGQDIPLSITFSEYTIDDDTYFAGILRDITDQKRHTEQLERLNELGQALSDVQTHEEACERLVEAARDTLGLSITTLELYNEETGQLESCARTQTVSDLVGDAPLFAEEDDFAWQSFLQNDPKIIRDLRDHNGVSSDDTPLASVILLPIESHGILISGATTPDAFSERTETLARILVGTATAVFDRLDREAALREQASELEAKNEQLRRVQRVNSEIRDITTVLIEAETNSNIKERVCQELADSDPYRFVWFGERDYTSNEIVPTAWAGVEEGYLDTVTITADMSATGQGPAGRAIRTREAQIQNNLRSDPPFEPWRQEALARGYRASISIPVAYQDTLYGLLNLYAGEAEVFTEMEQAVLTELGEMIGYALNAMERYDALVSEDAVELEFIIRDDADPFLAIHQAHGGKFRLETVGSRVGDGVRVFGAFEDVSGEDLSSVFEQHPAVDMFTVIRERDGEIIVEIVLAAESMVTRLLNRGAVPTAIHVTSNEERMTIRIAKTASVREYVEFFDHHFDSAELVARREAHNPVQTKEAFEREYLAQLTDRQQQVLQTAYFAGFFEQPRDSSARDIADLLDVSQPTVSRHIRASERKLFSELFGDRDSA